MKSNNLKLTMLDEKLPPTFGLRTGRIVDYVLTEADAAYIQQRRAESRIEAPVVQPGDHVPSMVTGHYAPATEVNLRLILDGPDLHWVTSRPYSEHPRPGTWHWLERDLF